MRLPVAILLALIASTRLESQEKIGHAVVTGRVVDHTGQPLPSVTVIGDAPGFLDVWTSTDARGEFRLTGVGSGAALITAEMNGFFSSTATLMLDASVPRDVTLTLWERPWVETASFIRPDVDFYADATAIAYIRIVSTLEPRKCNESKWARHAAMVLSTAKGTLPSSIWIDNTRDLFCYSPDRVEYPTPEWSVGDEFVAFLAQHGDRFMGVYGHATIFKLKEGKVEDVGFGPENARMVPFRTGDSVAQIWSTLRQRAIEQKK